MRVKLLIKGEEGDRRELFAVPQAARTIEDVLASVARDFELEDELACFAIDNFHVWRQLEAWKVIETRSDAAFCRSSAANSSALIAPLPSVSTSLAVTYNSQG